MSDEGDGMREVEMRQAILAFLYQVRADVVPVKTRQVAEAVGVSVYTARYHLMRLLHQQCVSRGAAARGKATRWRLLV